MPARGCLPELVDDTLGLTYDPARPGALQRAMEEIRERDLVAASAAARARAESLDWRDISLQILAAYRGDGPEGDGA